MPGKGRGSKGKDTAKKGKSKRPIAESTTSSDDEAPMLTLKKARKTKKITPPPPPPELDVSSGHEEEAEDSSSAMPPPAVPAAPGETQSSQSEALTQVTSDGKKFVNLTEEQEEAIVDWIKSHPMLYDKTDKDYR